MPRPRRARILRGLETAPSVSHHEGTLTRVISARCPRRRSSVVAGEHRGPVLDCGTGLRRVRGMRAACVWPPLGGPIGVPLLGTHEARS